MKRVAGWQFWKKSSDSAETRRFHIPILHSIRRFIRSIISVYSRNRVAKELHKFIDLYTASFFLQRGIILSLIALIFIITRDLHADTRLYVAIVTLLIGLYTGVKCIACICLYVYFCIRYDATLSPYRAIYLITADEIKRTIRSNHWSRRILIRAIVGNPDKFAHDVAWAAIYKSDLNRLITARLAWYGLVLGGYLLGYKILFEKLIGIDFTNFLHPFFWSWHYLAARAA